MPVFADRRPGLVPSGRDGRAGLAALEFGLIAPIFLALIFGVIDFSRYTFSLISIRHAAGEAVRAASLGRTEAEVQTIARAQAPFLGNALQVTCTGCVGVNPNQLRTYSVTLNFSFSFLLPFLPSTTIAIQEQTQVSY